MTCPSCTYTVRVSARCSSVRCSSVAFSFVLRVTGARQLGTNPPPHTRPTSRRQWKTPSFCSASRSRPFAWRQAAFGIGNAVPGDDRNAEQTRSLPSVSCKEVRMRSHASVARTCASPSAYAYAPTTMRLNLPVSKTVRSHSAISGVCSHRSAPRRRSLVIDA